MRCALPWVYFDLGANTLLDTKTTDFKQVFYMSGALEYLTDLRGKGYHLGLLVNIPASWGATQSAKLAATRAFILDKWTDSRPMDWSLFDLGVKFPPSDAERKPKPYLFLKAAGKAHAAGCEAVYEGTIAEEIPAATAAGLIGIHLGAGLWDGAYYYPEAKLRAHDFLSNPSGAINP